MRNQSQGDYKGIRKPFLFAVSQSLLMQPKKLSLKCFTSSKIGFPLISKSCLRGSLRHLWKSSCGHVGCLCEGPSLCQSLNDIGLDRLRLLFDILHVLGSLIGVSNVAVQTHIVPTDFPAPLTCHRIAQGCSLQPFLFAVSQSSLTQPKRLSLICFISSKIGFPLKSKSYSRGL